MISSEDKLDIEMKNELVQHDFWNRRFLFTLFAALGTPASYLDIGCGTGIMVKTAQRLGVDAKGLDIIADNEYGLINHDLRKPFDLGCQFAFLSSIEVAEHVPEESAEILVESICKHMGSNSILVWTAAGPGQGGIGHVNLKLGYYWRDMFYSHGVSYREDYTMRLKGMLSMLPAPSRDWWIGNLQVFDK